MNPEGMLEQPRDDRGVRGGKLAGVVLADVRRRLPRLRFDPRDEGKVGGEFPLIRSPVREQENPDRHKMRMNFGEQALRFLSAPVSRDHDFLRGREAPIERNEHLGQGFGRGADPRDLKGTLLTSSHGYIPYPV